MKVKQVFEADQLRDENMLVYAGMVPDETESQMRSHEIREACKCFDKSDG